MPLGSSSYAGCGAWIHPAIGPGPSFPSIAILDIFSAKQMGSTGMV